MPTYDFRCQHCGEVEEAVARMSCRWMLRGCLKCGGAMQRMFSPNSNIVIPRAFRAVTQGFNSGGRGPDSAPYSDNNSVHAPQRQSFTQAFDANVKKAGGIG